MAKKFTELEARMSADAIARSDEKAQKLRDDMTLNELRAALDITQEQLATLLNVKQAAVSKIERRTDMYVSTLASVIKAMGGDLEIAAKFPGGRVRITQFRQFAPQRAMRRRRAEGPTKIAG